MVRNVGGKPRPFGDKKKKISINDASSDSSVIKKDSKMINNNVSIQGQNYIITNDDAGNNIPIEWLSYNDRDVSLLDDKGLKEWIAENPRTFKAIENGLRDRFLTIEEEAATSPYLPSEYLQLVFLDNRDLTRNMIAKRFSLFAYDDMWAGSGGYAPWAGSGGQKTFERDFNKYLERSVNEIDTAEAIAEFEHE